MILALSCLQSKAQTLLFEADKNCILIMDGTYMGQFMAGEMVTIATFEGDHAIEVISQDSIYSHEMIVGIKDTMQHVYKVSLWRLNRDRLVEMCMNDQYDLIAYSTYGQVVVYDKKGNRMSEGSTIDNHEFLELTTPKMLTLPSDDIAVAVKVKGTKKERGWVMMDDIIFRKKMN